MCGLECIAPTTACQSCIPSSSCPCPNGRTLCGDECVPTDEMISGHKKECGGRCMAGKQVCAPPDPPCSIDWVQCGNLQECVQRKYFELYGFRECNGRCVTASEWSECGCGSGHFECGNECK